MRGKTFPCIKPVVIFTLFMSQIPIVTTADGYKAVILNWTYCDTFMCYSFAARFKA